MEHANDINIYYGVCGCFSELIVQNEIAVKIITQTVYMQIQNVARLHGRLHGRFHARIRGSGRGNFVEGFACRPVRFLRYANY